MGNPSTTHERERRSSSHHHHHRTISSTTLLLALSLILAVLAITLSIPSYNTPAVVPPVPSSGGLSGLFGGRRDPALLSREQAVARREFEVAQREAELLAGSPVGIAVPTPIQPTATVAVVTQTVTVEVYPHVPTTIVKEIVEGVPAPHPVVYAPGVHPTWYKDAIKVGDVYEREQKIGDREKEVSEREEKVGKRESEAAKREAWIMEQLVNLGTDKFVEEEVVYETPKQKRKPTPETQTHHHTTEIVKTVTAYEPIITAYPPPSPSNIRIAQPPAPEIYETIEHSPIGKTTEVVKVWFDEPVPVARETGKVPQPPVEEYEDEEEEGPRTVKKVRRVKKIPGIKKKW